MMINKFNVIFFSNKMHFADNPFSPKYNAEKDKIIHDDLISEFNKVFSNPSMCVNKLPKDYKFCELSLLSDGEEILKFINMHYYNDKYSSARIMYDKSTIQFLAESGEAIPYAIKYKNMLIALQIIEYVNINYANDEIPSAHADFLIIHPKFRKTFLVNVFTALVYGKTIEHGSKLEFWGSHTDLHFKHYLTKHLYNLSLDIKPCLLNMCRNEVSSSIKNIDINYHIHKPSIDEIRKLNTKRYKLQYIYSEKRLESLLNNNNCFSDGENLAIFTVFFNVMNDNVPVKTAVLTDYISPNSNISFRKFFKHVLNELRTKYGVELVTIINGDSDDIISFFNFEKNCDMFYYMMNMLPNVKRHEVMMNFR